jgi:hypothetical protein
LKKENEGKSKAEIQAAVQKEIDAKLKKEEEILIKE